MSEVRGCASSFGRSPKREIGFVSFVRASGRGEAACLRERDYASLRWVINSRILLPFFSFSFAYVCVLHGFYRFSKFVDDMCMSLMHFQRFLNVLHGFY